MKMYRDNIPFKVINMSILEHQILFHIIFQGQDNLIAAFAFLSVLFPQT